MVVAVDVDEGYSALGYAISDCIQLRDSGYNIYGPNPRQSQPP